MTKHSAGPWKMTEILDHEGGNPTYQITAESTLFLNVTECADGYVPGQNEANARLISAAPDLLSLLKEIIGEIDDWAHEDVIKRAEALIARIDPEAVVDAWNRDNETGRAVTVLLDSGETIKTVTMSCANLLGGHTPVIWLEGISGCYALERVTPYDGVDDIPDADRAGGGTICQDCGKEFYKHPADLEHLGKGGVPFLTRLCSGRIVKL